MVVGRNYGTGSSRATGVSLPLAAWGVKVYIGESFGPIFVTNAVQYGVLTITLPRPTVNRIADWVRKNSQNRDITKSQITVDLEKQVIDMPGEQPIPFDYNPRYRNKLLNGLDDFAEIQPNLAKAQDKRRQDQADRPWYHGNGDVRDPTRVVLDVHPAHRHRGAREMMGGRAHPTPGTDFIICTIIMP